MKLGHSVKVNEEVTAEDVAAVLAEGREIWPAPDVVRARLLARARDAVATANERGFVAVPTFGWHGRRVAVGAAALLGLSAAGATAAALYNRVPRAVVIGPAPAAVDPAPARAPKASSSVRAPLPQAAEDERAAEAPPRSKRQHAPRPLSVQESYAAELRLLQSAQSDYTSQDFPDALVMLAEHARRFPDGRLAEEREALRIRSLEGAGRDEEARRALAAFAERFPHSALLPRLQQQVQASAD